jgi:hypothetical protein
VSPMQWILLLITATAAVFLVGWLTRRLSLFKQFLVLLSAGVTISFLLMMLVQLPEDRPWLATLLVVAVFIASPIAVRLFLRGLYSEDESQSQEIQN